MKIFTCVETLAYTYGNFCGILSGHVSIVEFLTRFYSKYIPVALLEWISLVEG